MAGKGGTQKKNRFYLFKYEHQDEKTANELNEAPPLKTSRYNPDKPLPKGRWNNDDDEDEDDATLARKGARNATDIARARLDKLMKNPAKPVSIPESSLKKKTKDPNKAPEFVYNVMGSSAGAGSGEFHVYRQIRRKEMFRTRILDREREKGDLDDAFQVKVAEVKKAEDEKSDKKRKKRNKKKEAAKKRREAAKKKNKDKKQDDNESDEDSDEDSNDESDKEVEKK